MGFGRRFQLTTKVSKWQATGLPSLLHLCLSVEQHFYSESSWRFLDSLRRIQFQLTIKHADVSKDSTWHGLVRHYLNGTKRNTVNAIRMALHIIWDCNEAI
ncbi:uncharacterized protein LOC132172673 [Corylus avellana]|uniref:uncharacterized protein LOC132172673 n=1 Tax=Corylus avellana TaxID=13451 RepID=UPI00286A7B09|nr:uncharacterized protein LOC132172673 [Corylus avellana]